MQEVTNKSIALPVIQKKKHNRKRWLVLIAVQVLIFVHIAVWLLGEKFGWFGGKTLTPIEPSEGMEFVRTGVINAGAIFFAVALLSTLIFGRWFCGWGCHIVLLQDACLWILRKMHIRPKPFRARWLMWFPFGLAVYMFIWPLFYRIALAPWLQPELRWPEITAQLLTEDFWESFVPPLLAIPFLFICGFATVYVLGAKGFCTYGCPYGGFFKPLDAVSPMRVRVNDNCRQCGKCTAVCTSNVRVHEEVHLYKMVVDSGCMKIMDCIDACPNDALSIGFGKIPKVKEKPLRKYDLTLKSEIGVTLFFLFGFFSYRGMYAVVPMLMAVGMSLVATWLVWKGIKILMTPNVSFHKTQLRFHGKLRPAGRVFLLVAFSTFLFTVQSAAIHSCNILGDMAVLNNDKDSAMMYYKLSGPIHDGGLGFTSNPNIDLAMSRIYESQSEFREAERLLWRVDSRVGADENVTMLLGQMMQYHQQELNIKSFYEDRLNENKHWEQVWEDYVGWLKRDSFYAYAIETSMESVRENPDAIRLNIQLVLLETEYGNVENAIALATTMTEIFQNNPMSWRLLARALDKSGDYIGAMKAQSKAIEIQSAAN